MSKSKGWTKVGSWPKTAKLGFIPSSVGFNEVYPKLEGEVNVTDDELTFILEAVGWALKSGTVRGLSGLFWAQRASVGV